MDIKKYFVPWVLAGLAILILEAVVAALVQAVMPYSLESLAGMRTLQDPLMVLYFLTPWLVSLGMVVLYAKTKESFKETHAREKAIMFGFLVWLVAVVPTTFVIFTTMTYPLGFSINKLLGGLVAYIGGAYVIIKTITST
ncbi:MAG: hypothetical protein DRO04_02770 [Candidatus Iainarchaeum archaeon]|uniref:Uncharacterized protein n=1 Tax=Candidatus Iainarchaeum sp. TaxID=3101447 RepID=A0A497JFZ6_9ARCH|nr:MAG: hypothetical protein DRO04_02770 [Candidatus Diapherotrites archaeon]